MLYLDTSVIVASLSTEVASPRIQDWLAEQRASRLHVSEWTLTELSSAVALKVRTGQFDLKQRAAALAIASRWIAESFTLLPITSGHFRTAARIVDHYRLALRAGDALHLAVASDHGATVHTLDRRLAEAGPVLGIATQLLA